MVEHCHQKLFLQKYSIGDVSQGHKWDCVVTICKTVFFTELHPSERREADDKNRRSLWRRYDECSFPCINRTHCFIQCTWNSYEQEEVP